jgi:hypothetical protein
MLFIHSQDEKLKHIIENDILYKVKLNNYLNKYSHYKDNYMIKIFLFFFQSQIFMMNQ